MGDLPRAGAMWFAAGAKGPEADAAVAAWREQCGDDFAVMWRSLPAPVREEPRAARIFNGPWGNRNLFMALSHAIQSFFRTGVSPYPVERTLLASGVVDAAMHSAADGKPVPTPHLEFAYAATDFKPFRETGASWAIVEKRTEDKHLHTLGRS